MKTRTLHELADVSVEQWNSLNSSNFPFMEHGFLNSLETSQSVGVDAGWIPMHQTLWDSDQLIGAMILYQKSHSYGEYIFDWGWAEAYERHGLNYYPKWVSAVPFTPATGQKLLVHPDADQVEVQNALLDTALSGLQKSGSFSMHSLFITPEEVPVFVAKDFLIRHSFQYHWKNRNYESFEHFLSALKRKRRKEILRERKQVQDQEIEIRMLEGEQIEIHHMEAMFRFYLSTSNKKWGQPYLNWPFFQQILNHMKDQLVLFLAFQDQECIAGTINYKNEECLYGRYWGCLGDYRSLHFELCYYQPIEYAIKNGMKLFEAGAQGEHKIQRGFLPELTYSAHWLLHREFKEAIARFLEQEKKELNRALHNFSLNTPYQDAI